MADDNSISGEKLQNDNIGCKEVLKVPEVRKSEGAMQIAKRLRLPDPIKIEIPEYIVAHECQTRPDSKLIFVYRRAIPERTLGHLKGVKGIGDSIAKKLVKRLEEYNKEHHIDEPDLYSASDFSAPTPSLSQTSVSSQESTRKKRATNRQYIPGVESGGYAILLALLRHAGPTRFMSKSDIIAAGQQYCKSSFTIPKSNTNNATSWNSISTLEKNNLVAKTGRPARYTLTDEGEELAEKLYLIHTGEASTTTEEQSDLSSTQTKCHKAIPITVRPPMRQNMLSSSDDELDIQPAANAPPKQMRKSRTWAASNYREFIETNTKSSSQKVTPTRNVMFQSNSVNIDQRMESRDEILNMHSFHSKKHLSTYKAEQEIVQGFSNRWRTIPPGDFDVYIVVDNREVRNHKDRDYFFNELRRLNVKTIRQVIEVGDFCWVAKVKDSPEYIMLNHIVERKKNDDLVSSIMDGRFKEQKHRLSISGVENIVYLVEEFNPTAFHPDAMATALTQTQILNNFFLKQTANVEETVMYLKDMTNVLSMEYKKRPLHVLEAIDIQKDTHLLLRSGLCKKHGHPFFIPFGTFNELMTKSKAFTIGDVYLRQLLSIRGLSQEKAMALVKKFPTIKSMYLEIQNAQTEKEKVAVLTSVGSTPHRKLIGPALAKKIVQLFTL
ncbi:Crossover junction endonuclease mus81 [Boothiomyces sp. JEL0866]|nr:Crossover junction endonuclease mus81 [Boothiomyces sp. JEL0866]